MLAGEGDLTSAVFCVFVDNLAHEKGIQGGQRMGGSQEKDKAVLY